MDIEGKECGREAAEGGGSKGRGAHQIPSPPEVAFPRAFCPYTGASKITGMGLRRPL